MRWRESVPLGKGQPAGVNTACFMVDRQGGQRWAVTVVLGTYLTKNSSKIGHVGSLVAV